MTLNTLTRTVEKAKNMIREVVKTMNLSSYWKYKLKVSNPQIPLLYGLPKTHNEGNKMRPITSNVDSPFLNISLWLLNELKHIVGMEGFDVSISFDFIQK
jgi:hypothetical protein